MNEHREVRSSDAAPLCALKAQTVAVQNGVPLAFRCRHAMRRRPRAREQRGGQGARAGAAAYGKARTGKEFLDHFPMALATRALPLRPAVVPENQGGICNIRFLRMGA
jgi:hypothetical protein